MAGNGFGGVGVPVERTRAVEFGAPVRGDVEGFVSKQLPWDWGNGSGEVWSRSLRLAGAERITRPYEENGWVHACVNAISDAVQSVPLVVYRGDPLRDVEGAEPLGLGDPLMELVRRPNDHQTPGQFAEAGVVHLKLDGEDIWFLFDDDGRPVVSEEEWKRVADVGGRPRSGRGFRIPMPASIVPVRGASVEVVRNKHSGLPEWYVYPSSPPIRVPWVSVVHFKQYDPNNPLRGLGDAEVALRDIQMEFQAQRYQEALLRNGGDPGGWVIARRPMSEGKMQAVQRKMDDARGNVGNAGRWQFAAGMDLDIKPNPMRPRDMEYRSLLEWIRDKICSVMGVPPAVIGVLEDATYSNLGHAIQLLWKGPNGVLSYLRSREEVVNSFFLPRLDRRDAGELVARHDLSGVDALKVDESEQLSVAATIATKSTGWSVNDVARMLGVQADLPEGGEVVLVDQSKITMDGLEEREEAESVAADAEVSAVPSGAEEHGEASVSSEAEAAKVWVEVEKSPKCRREGETKSECMSRKIPEIMRDRPDMEQRQAVAVAASMCSKPCKSCDGLVTKDSPEPVRKQAEFQEPYEEELAEVVERWYGDVLAAQSKRLASFARAGKDALKHTSDRVRSNGVRVVKVPDGEIDPSRLTLTDLEDLLVDQEEWAVKLSEVIAPVLGRTFTDTSELWARLLGTDPFLPTDRSVIEYVRLNSVRLAEDLSGEVGRLVQERLLGVLRRAHGTNLMELQTAVREVLPAISDELQRVFGSVDARAQTIARTEVGKASSAAKYEEYKKANVERHVWISSRDEYVRPAGRPDMEPWSHVELDGQVRNVGDEFRTGLKFPLDPEADPRDRINCRCVTIPEVQE